LTTTPVELPCPSCGFLTVGEPCYGTYGICPLCDWEDDQVQLANPLTGGGANRESLREHQQRSVTRWPLTVKEVTEDGETYRRDLRWRPLSKEEVEFYASRTNNGHAWVFNGVVSLDECYWLRSPVSGGSTAV
jgi:hypothetical protein